MSKSETSFIQIYKNLLRTNYSWFRKTLILFGVSGLVGVGGYFAYPDLITDIARFYEEAIGPDVSPGLDLSWRIFTQNLTATLMALFGGIILGIGSFLTILVNGFLLGYVVTFSVVEGNFLLELIAVIVAIAPHGIFEIPAIILAAGMGFKMGLNFWKKENQKKRWQVFTEDFDQAMYLLLVIILLLIVAALVEGMITIRLVS